MASKKHYIIVSITLGAIAAASAALIGVTNLVTRNKIAENERKAIAKGLNYIFDGDVEIKEENDLTEYKYVTHYYALGDNKCAFRTDGSNMYGKVSLIIGFNAEEFVKLYVIKNEQTYASTLVDNYINPLNNDERDYDDVKCGATYGASLVRDMIDDATKAVKKINGKE